MVNKYYVSRSNHKAAYLLTLMGCKLVKGVRMSHSIEEYDWARYLHKRYHKKVWFVEGFGGSPEDFHNFLVAAGCYQGRLQPFKVEYRIDRNEEWAPF